MTSLARSAGDDALLFARLEVIDDQSPRDAALNMATDEALLENLGDTALLRIYRWRRPAVSFGFFNQFAPVSAAYPERELVRRWTGGGAVAHGQDFTYSLVVPRIDPLTALRAEESYRLLHEAVAMAIAAAGPALPALETSSACSAPPQTSPACFVNAVRYDLLLAGEKIAGAAQRRTRRGWLHQGSVQLPGDTADFNARLCRMLPAALAAETHPRLVRPDEEDAAHRLVRTKYGTDAWLRRF